MTDQDLKERAIRSIVCSAVKGYANGFSDRYINDNKKALLHYSYLPILDVSFRYYTDLDLELGTVFNKIFKDLGVDIAMIFCNSDRESSKQLFSCVSTIDGNLNPKQYWNKVCSSDNGYAIVVHEFLLNAENLHL